MARIPMVSALSLMLAAVILLALIHRNISPPLDLRNEAADTCTRSLARVESKLTMQARASADDPDGLFVSFPDGAVRKVPASEHSTWWLISFVNWERATFIIFHAYLSTGAFDAYVGFGEWIGPTLLFSAPYVLRAFALEPDPIALRILRANVAANPDISTCVFVSGQCIAPKSGALTLRGNGGSGSWITDLTASNTTREYVSSNRIAEFSVDCVHLREFVESHSIDLQRAFIKIDAEGAEWGIVPSLHAMVEALPAGRRPTFFISLHESDRAEEGREAFLRFARLFSFAGSWTSEEHDGPLPITSPSSLLSLQALTPPSDIILSDL